MPPRDINVERPGLSVHDSVASFSVGDVDVITITIGGPFPSASSRLPPPRPTPSVTDTRPSLPTITTSSTNLPSPSLTSPSSTIILTTSSSTSTSSSTLTPTLLPATPTPTLTFSSLSDFPTDTPTPTLEPTTSTVLQTIQAAPSATQKSSSSQNTFFANKALSGTVFGIGGLVVLILILTFVTYTVRRARRNKLSTISFDPDITSDTLGGLIEAGHMDKRSVGASTSGHGHDSGNYDAPMYPEYASSQNLNQYPAALPYAPQTYYNQRPSPPRGPQQPSMYNVPSALIPGYDTRPGAGPDPQYRGSPSQRTQQAFPAGMPPVSIPRRNDTLQSRAILPSQSPYVRSSTAPVLSTNARGGGPSHATSHSRELDPALPPIPTASPLPDRFGRDEPGNRESIEADAQFWSRTLKVANE